MSPVLPIDDGSNGRHCSLTRAFSPHPPLSLYVFLISQEYIALNRWTALRSLYPITSPWSSVLFLYLKDPVLKTSSSSSFASREASPTPPGMSAETSPPRAGSGTPEFHRDSGGDDGVSDPNDSLPWSLASDGHSSVGDGPSSLSPSSSSSSSPSPSSSISSSWLSTLWRPTRYCLRAVEGFVGRIFLESAQPSFRRRSRNSGADTDGASEAGAAAAVSDVGENEGGGGYSGGKSKGGGSADSGDEQPRRLFLEFFGPVVAVFSALGFSTRMAEWLTMMAVQACPLLAAMPLLRLSSRRTVGGDDGGENATAGR